jgi:hypothetical protein
MGDLEVSPEGRRRRITTSSTALSSKFSRVHSGLEDTSGSLLGSSAGLPPSTKPEIVEEIIPEEITWYNIKQHSKPAKVEKFLWDANISNEIGKIDNFLLKVQFFFVTVDLSIPIFLGCSN